MLKGLFTGNKEQQQPGVPPPAKALSGNQEWMNSNNERYYGMENFGNTCYCNSVLQSLYFCGSFRRCVLGYNYPVSAASSASAALSLSLPHSLAAVSAGGSAATLPIEKQLESLANERGDESLLTTMRDLFLQIATAKKRTGVCKPSTFVARLKKENELFQGVTQQDAQEFLNYLLNAIAEILLRHKKEFMEKLPILLGQPQNASSNPSVVPADDSEKKSYAPATWVHELFEGLLTNETKCRTCETTTNRDEAFLDLSVDVSQHSSISTCLRNFSTSETLCAKDKFYCDACKSLQEAEKRMKIKRLPNVLALHLKRFKYQENVGRFVKLNYRVASTTN